MFDFENYPGENDADWDDYETAESDPAEYGPEADEYLAMPASPTCYLETQMADDEGVALEFARTSHSVTAEGVDDPDCRCYYCRERNYYQAVDRAEGRVLAEMGL